MDTAGDPLRAGKLLVATPQLDDPNFSRTVVLLLQVDEDDGALGLVLNRPTGTDLGEVLADWEAMAAAPGVVFRGGPVSPTAAICLGHARLDAPAIASFAPLEGLPSVGTVDLDAVPQAVFGTVERVRVFAGYAGWAAGQLEAEVEEGAWWVVEALPRDALVERPELLWRQVLLRQGPPLAFAASYPPDPTLN